jgi:hypothetical protein
MDVRLRGVVEIVCVEVLGQAGLDRKRMVDMKGAYGRATELKDIWERRRRTDSID